jgi:tetratricopeptide (TPR) repeat protein
MPAGDRFNPFPGLRPFEPEEDHLFFGREKQIDELLRRLRSCRFLSVVGTSGSGKSSLVRSGLIPSLQSGFMAKAGSSWRIATFRPGEDPIGHLAASLNSPDVLVTDAELASTNRVLIEATLRRSTRGLVEAVRQARIPPHDNVLVVVDQFEELFRYGQGRTAGNSRDEAVAFVKLLLEAKEQGEIPIYIVVTMRSDFIGECMEFAGLPEAVNNGQYLVPRMTRDELRSAITGPVAVGGAEITPRLVLRLLNEVGNDHDQLPVLQHALMRTWDHWQRQQPDGRIDVANPIDVSDYDAIGTMRLALSLHAEEAYQETLFGQGQQIAERMFKALTDTFSDPRGIRRPTSIKQLSAICEVSEPEVIRIVEIFRRAGRSFLMPPPTTPLESRSIVDVSHESLMRCWTRLIAWAEEERASARTFARLSQASAWFDEGTAGLWHNPELELGVRWKRQNHPTEAWAERYNSSFARAMDFLDRSEKEQGRIEAQKEKERKKKLTLAWTVAGALGLLLLMALYSYYFARRETARADHNLMLARNAVDQSLSSVSQQAREAPDLPQLEQFRQQLLEKAEVFYSALAEQSKSDPGFREESVKVHSTLGDINRLLEKRDDAVAQYQMAIQGFEELHRDKPRNAEYRRDLAYAHNWLGETLRPRSEGRQNARDNDAAEQEYDAALRLQKDLHDEVPQNADYQQDLARTYDNRGILRFYRGDLKTAEPDFNQAMQLLEPLAKNEPSHELVRVYNNLSTLLRAQGQLPKAQELSERAIRIQQELMKKDPNNWEYREELAMYYNNLAFLLLEKGDLEMAEHQNHAALDSIEALATLSPSMETERAKAHMLYPYWGTAHHPEFHVLYQNLGQEYVRLATTYLQAGAPDAARLAVQSLGRVLPEVSEPDRTSLEKSYRDLQKQLQEAKTK